MRADRAQDFTNAEPIPDATVRIRLFLTALLLGAALLWPLPLGGALLMVAASFGLVIAWEGSEAVPPATLLSPLTALPALPIHADGPAPVSP